MISQQLILHESNFPSATCRQHLKQGACRLMPTLVELVRHDLNVVKRNDVVIGTVGNVGNSQCKH